MRASLFGAFAPATPAGAEMRFPEGPVALGDGSVRAIQAARLMSAVLPTEWEVRLAEILCERIPSLEHLRHPLETCPYRGKAGCASELATAFRRTIP